ncbi:MAG: hypothetical protein WCP96_16145 [Methylococcaceae bacterium]
MNKPVCVVIGVGVGNEAAITHKFFETGHKVALLARTLEFTSKLAGELDDAIAIACDVINSKIQLFKRRARGYRNINFLSIRWELQR